jgi:hypothetical protein
MRVKYLTFYSYFMKKGLVIVIVLVLALCALAAAGVGVAYWYLKIYNTPLKAFEKAVTAMNEDATYEMDGDGSAEMELKFDDYPEYNSSTEMTMEVEGREDIANSKSYVKTTNVVDGDETVTELYTIGDDMYQSVDGADFEKMSEADAETSQMNADSISGKITKDTEFTLLDGEKVKDVDCYHYKIDLTESLLEDFIDSFVSSFSDSMGSDVDIDEPVVEDAYMELWISKSDSSLVKQYMNLGKITLGMESMGSSMELVFTDFETTVNYSKWGEAVDIEAPI